MTAKLLVVSGILGVVAALLGAYHGYGEILQGDAPPEGIVINAFGGPDCAPEGPRNCFPAMTILPTSFFIIGIATVIVALLTVYAAVDAVRGKFRGATLLVASILLLLVGGGFLAPILGIIGAVLAYVGTRKVVPKQEAVPTGTVVDTPTA